MINFFTIVIFFPQKSKEKKEMKSDKNPLL